MSETDGVAVANRGHQIILNEIETLVRQRVAAQHGLQYGGQRKIFEVGGYLESPTYKNFRSVYERDPIAGQIVDMVAETTWRAPPEISEPDKPDGTPFTEAVATLVDRLGVWSMFERADRLARIGRYSVVLIGTGATDDVLKQPMRNLRGPDDVLFLAPYSEAHATIESWVEDGSDPRFGLPLTYKIDLASGVTGFMRNRPGTLEVHWSHCLHIAEGLLDDEVYGRPALLRIYNDLHDLQKISTSTAEAFWQRVAGILQAVIGAKREQASITDAELEELDTALKELYHDLRRTFYGQDIELKRLAESEPNPEAAADLYMTRISAGCGIPKRMLFGSETGERSSTEDQKSYLGSIAERQKNHAEPRALRPFLDRLVARKGLTRPGEEGYDVVWPTLFQVPELDVAEANLKRAQAAAALTPIGGDPTLSVEVDEDRNVWLIPRTADDPSPYANLPPKPGEETDEPPADTGGEMDEAA
jgi:hypothetical protein